jgi:hypothetical protein
VDGRVHGVGADGALEQLVHAGGRRDKRPRPRTPAAVGGDRADGGGRLEERARELRRRGGVVVVLHAVGVGHALDAVELHGPHQIEPNLPPGPGEREPPRRRRSSSKAGRGAAPDGEGNREGEGKGRERGLRRRVVMGERALDCAMMPDPWCQSRFLLIFAFYCGQWCGARSNLNLSPGADQGIAVSWGRVNKFGTFY